ncbi:hypothetical protein FRC10_008806 [Ceratobasidium sp. 414]|nr:hypothetical protein FRC10_008806 [Ceratobasidium sp. 414]
MPAPAAYSLLSTSSSNLAETHDEEDLSETWSSQRSPNHGWIPRTFVSFAFAARPSRLSRTVTRTNAVTAAALSVLCALVLLTALFGHIVMPEWITGKLPTLRECFELPAEELVWQTTRLPTERTPSCPFDPEPFVVLDEATPSPEHKVSNDPQWSGECLEEMLAKGKDRARSCDGIRSSLEEQHIDLVWTWVNGSSPLLEITRGDRAAEISGVSNQGETMAGLAAKLFRQVAVPSPLLRHSVRAALKHFIHDASSFFLIGSDLPVSVRDADGAPTTTEARVGQLPSWLALEEMGVDGTFTDWDRTGKQTRFRVNHHRDIFSNYSGTVFNSLAIESQFSNLQRIGVSDILTTSQCLYSQYMSSPLGTNAHSRQTFQNDDVFFSRNLNARDFHMGEHGIVMRMQNYITISPNPDIPQHDGLEWESLQYSNWLLSSRFGSRHRPYPTHLAKALSIPMLQEVADAWPDEIALVASRPFRGMKHTQGGETMADAYMVFLEHHWIVERWREVLLWSWIVARGWDRVGRGEDPDVWTKEVAGMAWKELGGSVEQTMLEVRRSYRSTLDNTHEWAGAKATSPVFSSLDGYPYSEDMGERGWVSEGSVCEIKFEHCFGAHESASRTFQRIAFEEPTACGDCIIRALINRSGKRGLEAFLPSASPRDPTPSATTPTLPISAKWQDADFRLSSVLKATSPDRTNIRDAVFRMLQRYRFVIGETPFMFAIVTDPHSAEQNVQAIQSDQSLAIVCVNDNVAEGDDQVREILGKWMDSRWNESAGWERKE